MRKIIIFGDSSFAERLSKYILFEKRETFLGFTQEDEFCSRNSILGFPVYPLSQLRERVGDNVELLLAVGYSQMNNLREKIYKILVEKGFEIGSWMSVNSFVYTDAVGEGTLVLPNTLIGPGCDLGKCNIFESSVTLSHDNSVGDFNFISTGVVIGGHTVVKNHCFFGLNSTIKSDIVMNDYTLLGSSCNILYASESYGVYVGNPARRLEKSSLELHI